ncbi:MAG TPA: sigma-70 family RNA polymerase sigma factor [Anaerolineae bacterium]
MSAVPTDGQLLARIREGDLSALGTVYDKYRLQVFHTALAITRDRQAAEDILQECFLKVFSYVDRIDASLPLLPWLYRVTVNLSYTWATRQSRWRTSLENLLDHLVAPPRTAPEGQFEARDLKARIQDAIESLPFNQRAVVILYYLSDLSLKEIAYVLDCPVGTIKSRLHYGRETLRSRLSRRVEQATSSLGMAYEFT